ncbi:MAG TPA: non-canonical purine NTP pyrophosphatase, RdgB/HAM1 family [Alphaproteobacteria bacterium]|nr:non-canonical purine NTP pyrophosphatase, RdgB/HAM1 family [Alphaproteobacteria bacterium]
MKEIIFASHNKGKIAEIRQILAPLSIKVISADEINLPDVEETGTTFEENAALKALTIAKLKKVPCLADDSGLCVDVLGGRPGVYSARYAPNRDFAKAMQMLLSEMAETKSANRDAHFSCVIVLGYPNGKYEKFEGRVDGQIIFEPRGKSGFGFDPIFEPNGYDKTFAELGSEVKNKISHRAKALEKFVAFLKEKGL